MVSIQLSQLSERAEEIVEEVQAGHTLELIHGGKRVAEIVPARTDHPLEARKKAWAEMLDALRPGFDLGGVPFTYEERHGR